MVNLDGLAGISYIFCWEDLKEIILGLNKSFSNTKIDITKENIYIFTSRKLSLTVTYWD